MTTTPDLRITGEHHQLHDLRDTLTWLRAGLGLGDANPHRRHLTDLIAAIDTEDRP